MRDGNMLQVKEGLLIIVIHATVVLDSSSQGSLDEHLS